MGFYRVLFVKYLYIILYLLKRSSNFLKHCYNKKEMVITMLILNNLIHIPY